MRKENKAPHAIALSQMEYCKGTDSYNLNEKFWSYHITAAEDSNGRYIRITYEGVITKHIGNHFESIPFEANTAEEIIDQMNEWIREKLKNWK